MPSIYNSRQKKNGSSRSRIISARVEATQAFLLNRDYKGKTSPVIRALLRLLFNKKIPNFEVLLQAEIASAEAAQEENLEKFRKVLVAQKEEKREGTGNGTTDRSGH